MNLSEEASGLLGRVVDEWDRAEELIKAAELHCGSVIFPSIQELRYAGRRLVDAFTEFKDDPNSEEGKSFLKNAEFDCFRARHDALDATLSKMMSDLDLATSELGPDAVLHAFPRFSELFAALSEVRELVQRSRADRQNRDAVYAAIEAEQLSTIFPLYKIFRNSEKLMKQVADSRDKQLDDARWHRNLAYGIAIISIFISIALAIALS